ncbi:L7Ae/L30e/S12e/Gadd45 family ribosomal protein [Caldisalinibacter kiritimatiensis]|uniref:Firmicutes ribosomal L7Ae family protein n=1 Tax=Caldisalinibacter kiritimatiensis TaxID=1304284 RepID=R1CGS5_9FIRM|nr:ribosomal L7Ae/L30e/S12e/Gadd45 family protein [Caldisalinibacter kiritimatiensis]EOD01480.1 Firmicutes ribosomal L7Ae family protein [Caldisalinibacter kiritimatiensis]
MIEELSSSKKVVGTKQTKRAIQSDEVKVVFVAKDADAQVVNDVIETCEQKGIELVYVDSKMGLGKACGIDVSAASAAVLK